MATLTSEPTFAVRRPAPVPVTGGTRRVRRTYSRSHLLEAIRRWVEQYGEPPSSADWEPSRARRMKQEWRIERFRSARWPTMRMVRTEFGSLNEAIRAAGFEPRPSPTRIRTQIRNPEEILRAIREWAALYGEPPAMSDWDPSRARRHGHQWRIDRYRAGDWPSTRTVCSHFGNFRNAVAAAGLEPRPQGRHATLAVDYQPPRLPSGETDAPIIGESAALGTLLAGRVRAVAEARQAADAWSMRGALVDLAALSLEWAEALGGEHPMSAMEMLAIRRVTRTAAS